MKLRRLLSLGMTAAAWNLTLATVQAATLYVSLDGSEAPPFATPETAARSIQRALDAATNGDTIAVAPGRYTGTARFEGKTVVLQGAGATQTVWDGAGEGPILMFEGQGTNAVVEGFTFTGGSARDGAAIFATNAAPLIRRNIIFANTAGERGAGIFVTGAEARPTIFNNVFAFNDDATPEVTDAHQVFVDRDSAAVLVNNTVVRGNGNAFLLLGSPRASEVRNNVLAWNGSRLGTGRKIGRGLCDFSGSAEVHHNVFFRNVRAAYLSDRDYKRVRRAERTLKLDRLSENLDRNPRLTKRPPRNRPDALDVSLLVPGPTSRILNAGSPDPQDANPDGSRNTPGHSGGPWGW